MTDTLPPRRGMDAIVLVDPLFDDPADADAMIELAQRVGRYRAYAEHEQIELPVGPGLAPRHDSIQNFLRQGGLSGSDEPLDVLVRRTSYFREEYAYGATVHAPGIEPFLHSERLAAAARQVHGLPLIEPVIAYANLLLPGQELAVHTDVPEFRGMNRKVVPQWLLVVMHHSGLFRRWRLHIATGVAWFGRATGGEFVCWPVTDGDPSGPGTALPATHGTAAVLDTDSLFHGVARVGGPDAPAPRLRRGSELHAAGDGWDLVEPDGTVAAHVPPRRGPLLGLVEGVLLRRRARATPLARPRRRPHARCRARCPRRRPRRSHRRGPPRRARVRAAAHRHLRAVPRAEPGRRLTSCVPGFRGPLSRRRRQPAVARPETQLS